MSVNTTFNPLYVDYLGGDHLAALMLSQIIYWYRPGKGGKAKINCFKDDKYWLVKSHKDWTEELRLTRRQSQRCLELLKQKGLIETVLFKFNGVPTVHIHCLLTNGNTISDDQLRAFHCTVTCNSLHPKVQSLTETTTETTSIESGEQKNRSQRKKQQGFPESIQGEKTGAEVEKEEIGETKITEEQAMATAAEILKKHQEDSKGVSAPAGKAGLYYLWKKRMSALTGAYAKELTLKDKGQLGQFFVKAGDKAHEALDFALTHWAKFAWDAKAKKGLATVPELPVPGFVLAHYDVLLQLIAQGGKLEFDKPKFVVETKEVAKPEPKEEVVEDKVSPEEVLASLALFQKKDK